VPVETLKLGAFVLPQPKRAVQPRSVPPDAGFSCFHLNCAGNNLTLVVFPYLSALILAPQPKRAACPAPALPARGFFCRVKNAMIQGLDGKTVASETDRAGLGLSGGRRFSLREAGSTIANIADFACRRFV
jgi:hypothetical protein